MPKASWEDLTRDLEELRRLASAMERQIQEFRRVASSQLVQEMRAAGPVGDQHLVYVHGICKHSRGYSNGWWEALHPYTNVFGDGTLDGTRHEVLWSDLVENSGVAPEMAALAQDGRAEWSARVRGVLEDRAAIHAFTAAPALASLQPTRTLLSQELQPRAFLDKNVSAAFGLRVPGINCVEDFTVYMFNDSVRSQIIGRFTGVVRPLLESGALVDVISHSWGTVVAYEGLRELEDAGLAQPNVRNFFTVGAALSIFLVQLRLRPANRDGHRPDLVQRWINLNAEGDPIGGRLKGRPFQVDEEFLHLPNLGCGLLDAACAHSSYFKPDNEEVNRDIFANFINQS